MNRILFAVLACAWSAAAEDADAVKRRLIGTWKLLSYVREESPSGAKIAMFGPHPSGYLIYAADGRMMVIFFHSDRRKPLGAVPNPSESKELLKGLVSYTGTYAVKGDTIVHHVDVSWNESRTGTDQTRFYKFEGDHLSLATTKSLDSVEGKPERPHIDVLDLTKTPTAPSSLASTRLRANLEHPRTTSLGPKAEASCTTSRP